MILKIIKFIYPGCMSATLTPVINHDAVSALEYESGYYLVNDGEEYLQIHADMAKIWANYKRNVISVAAVHQPN